MGLNATKMNSDRLSWAHDPLSALSYTARKGSGAFFEQHLSITKLAASPQWSAIQPRGRASMAIMITGGTGFIGAHLARRLLQAGETVVLFDAQPDRQAIQDIAERVTVVRGDVTVLQDLLHAIKAHRVERVVHLAYIVGPENEQHPPRALHINCVGTNNVFEAARLEGLQRVVWASSVAVYGPRSYYGKADLDEDDPPQPTRVYGACKLFNEHMAEDYFHAFL